MGGDDAAAGIDQDDDRLVRRAQAARECPVRINDRRPGPTVVLQMSLCAVGRIGDVEAQVRVVRIVCDELCVGDRLALAGRSPRRPDVDEDRRTQEVREGDLRAIECQPVNGRSWITRRIRSWGGLLCLSGGFRFRGR